MTHLRRCMTTGVTEGIVLSVVRVEAFETTRRSAVWRATRPRAGQVDDEVVVVVGLPMIRITWLMSE